MRALAIAIGFLAALPAAAAAQQPQPLMPEEGTVPGEVIVQFERGTGPAARGRARRAADVAVVRGMRAPGQQLLRIEDGRSVASAVRVLERDPRVRYAQPNFIYRATATVPDDPGFGQLWGLRNTGQTVDGVAGATGADIDATSAWDVGTGSRDVVVAVADTGVAVDHPDLAANMWSNPDEIPGNGLDDDNNGFVDDVHGADFIAGDGDPRDVQGHGTHVAGTIGAAGDNGVGVTGVAWETSLMAVRVLNAAGSGSSDGIADGFDYAGAMGADIVNASLGGGASPDDDVMSDAIAAHPQTLFVVAAGNGGADGIGDDNDAVPQTPCNFDLANLICVAATDQSDGLADFSNFGAESVDLGAPGVNVLSGQPHYSGVQLGDGFPNSPFPARWITGGTASWGYDGDFPGFIADSVDSNYSDDADTWARTAQRVPASDVGCVSGYRMRLNTEEDFDFLLIEASPDGSDWTVAGGWTGTTGTSFVNFETPFDGAPGGIFLRFHLVSDESVTLGGADLDAVVVANCVDDDYDGSEYAVFDGTSMATPHVAGAAALVWSHRPEATVAQLRSALLDSGDERAALNDTTVTGRRLDVRAAIEAIGTPAPRPVVQTGAASSVTQTAAMLNGTVNPSGTATAYRFEYGTTTAYGQRAPGVPANVGAGSTAQAVSHAITGLAPSTTYHYRLVGVRKRQSTPGLDRTFTTPAAPTPPSPPRPPRPPQPPPPAPPPLPSPPPMGDSLAAASIGKCRRKGRGRRARVVCSLRDGDAVERVKVRVKRGRKTVGRRTVTPNAKGKLSLRLGRKLRRRGRYKVMILLIGADGERRRLDVERFRVR